MTMEELIGQECEALQTMLLKKNKDYGSSVLSSPALAPDIPIQKAVLVRISDKIARLGNLAHNSEVPETDESFADTVLDLAGYCLLWRIISANALESDGKDE